MGFQEWSLTLKLNKELYAAFIRFQADTGLGRSYAALQLFIEGEYAKGAISEEVYKRNMELYSEPLVVKEEISETEEQKRDRLLLEQKDKLFLEMIKQFDSHKTNLVWLERVRKQVEKFRGRLKSADRLFAFLDNAIVEATVGATVDATVEEAGDSE